MHWVLAALLFQQNASAEEEFKRIEETLQRARSVSVTYRCEVAKKDLDKAELLQLEGSIYLKGQDKARLVIDFDPKDPSLKLIEVCDGQKLRHRVGSSPPVERPAPEAIRPSLEFAFSRLGVYYPSVVTGTFLWSHTPPRDGPDGYLRDAELSHFRMEQEIPAGRILSYRVKARFRNSAKPPRDVDVRLLYSPKTFLPLKRVLTVTTEVTSYSIAETYTTFKLDEDLPEGRFELDEGK